MAYLKYIGECPYSLLKESLVEEAIKGQFGSDAELLSWQIKDFTKKGDNYSSIVTSVEAKCQIGLNHEDTTFVVKMNSHADLGPLKFMVECMYRREPKIFKTVAMQINDFLSTHKMKKINIPKVYAIHNVQDEECFLLEDMRAKGFLMFDRLKGMDVPHALLVMKDLGRLHACSLLLQDKLETKDLTKEFPFLNEEFFERTKVDKEKRDAINSHFISLYDGAINFLKDIEGHEVSCKWFEKYRKDPLLGYLNIMENDDDRFTVLNHGDCWNNNLLFSYDEKGSPIDVSFVDLQGTRVASFALDLNYFLYTSLNGSVRKKNLELLLQAYYNAFAELLDHFKRMVPFTFEECKEEFKRKLAFGGLSAAFLLPMILAENEDIPDVDKGYDKSFEKNAQLYSKMGKENNMFKERFLSVFEELIENGTI